MLEHTNARIGSPWHCEEHVNDGSPQPSILQVKQIERAAAHQVQALARLRQARDPATRQSSARRCQLLLHALEHLVIARHHLEKAEQNTVGYSSLATTLDTHIKGLTALQEQVERMIQTDKDQVAEDWAQRL